MNINEIPEGFELVEEEVETTAPIDTFNEGIDPLLTDEEEVETEVEVETTDLEIPEGFELVVEEEVEEPVYSEEEIKEANIWVTPPMIQAANKKLKWNEDISEDNYDAWVGDNADGKVVEAWDLYKSENLGIEKEPGLKAITIEGLKEATTLEEIAPIINREYESSDLDIETFVDYLTEQSSPIKEAQEKDFKNLLGKSVEKFAITDKDGKKVYDIPEDKIEGFNAIVEKYEESNGNIKTNWRKANMIIKRYNEIAATLGKTSGGGGGKPIESEEYLNAGRQVERYDKDTDEVIESWPYNEVKAMYVDVPQAKPGASEFKDVQAYIDRFNENLRYRVKSGGVKSRNTRLRISESKGPDKGAKLDELLVETKVKDWPLPMRTKWFKGIDEDRNLKYWKNLLENDASNIMFTKKASGGKAMLSNFLPDGYSMRESGKTPWSDWVTITHDATGEFVEIGFDYKAKNVDKIVEQRTNLIAFLSKHSTRGQMQTGFEKSLSNYQIFEKASKLRDDEGGINVDYRKKQAYNKYSTNVAPNIFNPTFVKASTEAQRKERSKLGGMDLGINLGVIEKKGISVDELYLMENLGEIPYGSITELEEHEAGYHLVYNENAVKAQEEAVQILIKQKIKEGVKNQGTPELIIGLNFDQRTNFYKGAKGLNITQQEVDDLAREILGDKNWQQIQKDAFEKWVENDKGWSEEIKDQMGMLWKTTVQQSESFKKARLATAYLQHTTDILSQYIDSDLEDDIDETDPRKMLYSNMFKEWKEDKSIDYTPTIKPGQGYYVVDGRKIPSYIIDGMRNEEINFNLAYKNYEDAKMYSDWSIDKIEDFSEKIAIYTANYNDAENAGTSFALGTVGIVLDIYHGIHKIKTLPQDAFWAYHGVNNLDKIDKAMDMWHAHVDLEKSQFARVEFGGWYDADGNFQTGHFASYWFQTGAEQIPIYLAMIGANAVVPGGGLASELAVGLTAGLSTYSTTDYNMRQEKNIDGTAKWTPWEIWGKSLLSFGNETIFTTIMGSNLLKRSNKILKGNQPIYKKFVENKRQYLLRQVPEAMKGFLSEGSEEFIINGGNNLIMGDPILQGGLQTFTVGSVMGTTMVVTPSLYNMVQTNFTHGKDLNLMRENNDALGNIYNENNILKEKIIELKYRKFNENKEEKQLTQKLIDDYTLIIDNNSTIEAELIDANETVLLDVQENLVTKGFSQDAFNDFSESTGHLLNVDNQIKDIEKSDMDEKSKKQLLNILQLKFNGIRSNLEKFKSKKLWGHGYYSLLASSFFNKKNKERISEIRGEATTRILDKKGSEHDISPEELDQESATIYMEQEVEKQLKIDKKGNKDLKSVKTKEEGVIEISNYYDNLIEIAEKENDLKQKEKLEEQKDDAVEAIKSGSVNGVYLKTGNIKDYTINETFLAIEENMVANESKMAGAHEIGHGWSVRAMAKDPKQFKEFGEVLSKYLQKTHADVWKLMEVENTNLYNEDGTLDYEEVMSSFFEQIGKNKIKINPKGIWAGLMGDILNKGLKTSAGKTIPFKGQMDIINYLYGVGKNITDGTLTLETPVDPFKRLKIDKDGTEISEVSKTDITPKVSKSESRARKKINRDRKQVGEQINELAGDIQNANELATNLYNEILNPESTSSSARMIDNIIDNQLRINGVDVAAGNVYNKPIKEFRNEVKDQLLDKTIMRFDPKKAVKKDGVYDPGGFIVSELVNYRIGDVLKRYKPKAGEVSIDVPLESGKTREFVDESIDIEGAIDEKPTVTPRSKIKKQAPDLVTQELEDLVETAVLEIEAGVRPDVDDKVYKSFIQEVLEGKLTNEIKDRFGKGAEYDNFIKKFAPVLKKSMPPQFFVKIESQIKPEDRQFTYPPKRLTTQAEIDKATRSDQVYVENTAQGVNMYKLKDFSSRDLANFLLPPAIHPKTGKKSGRKGTIKTSVAKSVGVELGKDMIPSKFINKVPPAELAKINVKIQRDPTIKFHASNINKSAQNFYDNNKKKYGEYPALYNNTNPIHITNYQDITKNILPLYLPMDVVNSSNYASRKDKYGRGHFMTGEERRNIVKEGRKNESNFTDHQRKIVKEAVRVKSFTITKNGVIYGIDFASDQHKQDTKNNYEGFEFIALQLEKMVKDYPHTAAYVAALFNSSSGNSGHFIRQTAMPRSIDSEFVKLERKKEKIKKDYKKGLITEKQYKDGLIKYNTEKEHIWQQNQMSENLYQYILDGTVKDNFQIIKDNYFMVGLSNENNSKLSDVSGKYGESYDYGIIAPEIFINDLNSALRKGDISKAMSIWIRYFNSNVNNNNGGINPNNLFFDGKSVASIFNVDVSEEYRNNPEVVQLQTRLIEAQLLGQDVNPEEIMHYFTRDLATPKDNALKERKKEGDKNKVKSNFSQSANGNNVNRESQILDKALQIARDPNAPVKKIRVFDFDDTLARTKSNVIYNKPNTTGKPSSNLKAIVMAGGPGSGKSTVIKGLGLQKQGYKVVNQDISLEWAKKLVGLSAKEAEYDAVQRSVRSELGALARKIADKKLSQYTSQGIGVILDGTGASLKATKAKVQALKDMGYDVSMVYVETSRKTALERNQKREERSLKNFIVAKTWDSVNANKQHYKNEFGESFFEVNTDNLARNSQLPSEVINNIHSKLNATIRGKISPAEFASKGTEMEAEGATWDFSEFNKVVDGKEGPLLEVAKKIQEARGTEDVFVLTARTQEAAGPIKQFLESVGLNIPINNITGLGDSSPLAKSGWIVDKAAEGYNDFYFADDHGANVEAVQDALDALPVKGKTQQAKVKFSMNTKRDLKWRKHDFRFISNFEVEGKTYTIDLARHVDSKDYTLSFGLDRKDKDGFLKKDHFVTGTGNAAEILSIISNGVVDFVKKNKVNSINFTSFEGSRTRLYTTLTKLWANKLDWKHEIEYDPEYKDMKGAASFVISKAKTPFKTRLQPIQKVLDVIDVKGKVQQAKVKFSKSIDQKFNEIIEDKTGIESFKEFSPAKARLRGKKKGKFKFFVPPSADDFVGLLYHMLSSGKKGDAQMAWFKENLLDPYARAMADITRDRVQMMADFKALKKNLKNIPKNLRKEAFDGYTYENVIRIYAWNKQGDKIPGLSKADLAKVEDFMAKNPELQIFADQLIDITKGSGYNKPSDSWLSGTITTDFMDVLNNNKRKVHLKQWQDNVDLMFSEKNLNKLEAAFGSNYREALENMLHRMETGSNRGNRGSDRIANRFLDYVNNSVGIVMFFNMRSALLQTISAVNFINWSDNNMLAAAKAFANQPQFWKDFMHLMNSDFLVDRRNGLKINVSESEIADAAATSKNKAKGVIAYLLKKGFIPTQFADSFAIASGGATFYRNRVNKYIKDGMSQEEAEAKAFNDFREIAEESQQSSRPDRISQQQAGGLGRIILAFANTPMQYTRLIKKASLDLVNGRGDWKSNVSRIVYYAAVQNVIFNALQQALFALAWGEDDDEEKEGLSLKEKKTYGVINGMLDSILRGTGIAGGILSVVKNMSLEIYERSGKKRPEYADAAWRLLDLSPPIDIKVSKLKQAGNNYEYNQDLVKTKGFAIDNPAWLSLGLVVAATTNVPLDRLILKMNNVKYALNSDDDAWKRIAAILGYQEWQLRTEAEQEVYLKKRKAEKKEHKSLMKWEVIDGDEIEALSKREQTNILKEIGLSDEEIKGLKYEADRVNKILEEYDKDKKKVTKILDKRGKDKKLTKKEIEYNKIEDQTKAQQVETLTGYGLTKKEIRELKYEDDRIKKILELQEE